MRVDIDAEMVKAAEQDRLVGRCYQRFLMAPPDQRDAVERATLDLVNGVGMEVADAFMVVCNLAVLLGGRG